MSGPALATDLLAAPDPPIGSSRIDTTVMRPPRRGPFRSGARGPQRANRKKTSDAEHWASYGQEPRGGPPHRDRQSRREHRPALPAGPVRDLGRRGCLRTRSPSTSRRSRPPPHPVLICDYAYLLERHGRRALGHPGLRPSPHGCAAPVWTRGHPHGNVGGWTTQRQYASMTHLEVSDEGATTRVRFHRRRRAQLRA